MYYKHYIETTTTASIYEKNDIRKEKNDKKIEIEKNY